MDTTSPALSLSKPQEPHQPAKVRIAGLSKVFNVGASKMTALDNVSLDIREGEFVVVVGPSGCGKTTLLRIVNGLETATSGSVQRFHRDTTKPLCNMIFQEHAVFPWMKVRDNIAYGLRSRGVPQRDTSEIVELYISKVGLDGYADAYPYQLSGGMKQRVSIARAFANDPEMLCMDEPFAALDEQNKAILQEELMRIWAASRKTAMFITHSLDEAIALADRVVVMTARPGKIAAIFDIPFERPRQSYEIRRDPLYGKLSADIWDILRVEVNRSRAVKS
jgi:NitT/TauT family transport system ATP-binding protein